MSEILPVSLYGIHVGDLERIDSGSVTFRVAAEAVDRYGTASPVLSMSMPLVRTRSYDASADSFFGGLLPEGEALDRLATYATTSRTDIYGLIAAAGKDVAGAVTIGRPRSGPATFTPLADSDVAERLRAAARYPLGEIGGGTSLPGYQRKITLARFDGEFFGREGDAPSTHILKPSRAVEYLTALQTEAWVLDLAHRMDLAPYESFLQDFDGLPALVIERYDREVDTGARSVTRVHQEDAAQALGLGFGLYDRFEWHDARASLRSIADLLDRDRSLFSTTPSDRERLLRYVTFNVAVGNTDAHAKNFSLLHHRDGGVGLAPLYDVSAHALAFDADQRMAQSIGGIWRQPDVRRDDLIAESGGWGVDAARAALVIDETLDALLGAIDDAAPPIAFPEHLPNYLRHQATNLLAGRAAGLRTDLPPILLERIDTPLPGDRDRP
ncbi:type II toxin-antitoxin system HipA family toxin [soil metagenome]